MLSFFIAPISFNLNRFLGTGCRKFYPGQWTWTWTAQFGRQEWFSFAEAWTACKSIDCGSIHQLSKNYEGLTGYFLRSSTDLGGSPIPNRSHAGCWVKITDTKSTYCDDSPG